MIPLPTLIHDAVELLKASLNVVVGEELALDALEDLTDEATAQIGSYAHRAQADRASGDRPGSNLLLPLPQLVSFPPRPRKGVAAERTCDKSPLERLAEQLTRCTVAAALEEAGYVPSRDCIERYAHRLTNASLVRASALRTSPLVFEKACSMELIGRRVRRQVLGLQPRFSISSHTREPLWAKRYRT